MPAKKTAIKAAAAAETDLSLSERVLRAEINNIIAKVKKGKTLTGPERRLLDSYQPEDKKRVRARGAVQGSDHHDQNWWTIKGWASTMNVGYKTLQAKIKATGIEPNEKGLYLAKDIYRASSFSDIDSATAREREAKAELKEIELQEKRGELYNKDRIEAEYLRAFRITHSRIMALANVYAARCNPADPGKAKAELEKAQAHLLAPFDYGDEDDPEE